MDIEQKTKAEIYEQPKWVEIIIQLCKECKKDSIKFENGERAQNA
jgi:hypothetical protein